MKGPRKLVSGALNSVDIFEDPIHLNMGGETGLTSSLGGFLSLLIIIFIGVQAIFQSVEMFTRDGPQIIQMNEFEDDPELANLSNNNNFVMAVALTSNNNNVDFTVNTPLSFTATYSRYIRSDDGLQVKHKYQIYWAPCTEANFPSSIFPENTFTTYSLKYAYCPTHIDFTDLKTGICDESVKEIYPSCQTPPDFNILGTFLSQDFEFVQFKLNSCTQTDSKHIAGLNCANETVISNTFNTSELTLNLYYSNTLIDPVNYETPNKTYLDTIYWNVHPSVSTVADIFVDTETVQDFNDYFSTEEHTNRTFYSIQRESMRELQKFQASSLLEWNIRRSNLNHLTSRTYTKVLDVISNVGGMSELFIIAGALIAAGYVRYKYQMMLSNELYDFEPDDDKRPRLELPRSPETPFIELTNNFRTDSSTTPTNSKRRTLSQLFNSSFKKKKKKNIYESKSVKEYFEIQKKKKRILDYSEFSYLKAVLNSLICRKVPEEELAKKARNQVVQDLDIVKVVEKLKEIDKLKMLLLNSNQRKAFEFIEKPLITHEDEKPVLVGSMQRIEGFVNVALAGLGRNLINSPTESSVSEYAKVYIAYRALHEDTEIENVKYNNKLLDMINEDLRSVFKKVDQFMGPIPDAKRFDEIVKKLIEQKDLGTTFEDGLHTE